MLRSTYAVIHLPALLKNIRYAKRSLRPETKFLAVIKSNAYGHGIKEVGRYLEKSGIVDMLAVAIPEEGLLLRACGVTLPVLILGVTDPDHIPAVVANDLTPAVFLPEQIYALERCAKAAGKDAHAHVKLDTGMRRIGVLDNETLDTVLDAFDSCPHVKMTGAFTHFAKSESDPKFTMLQAERFNAFIDRIRARGYSPVVHAANSGATLDFPELQYDMVRFGIALYGYHPDPRRTEKTGLTPVMSLITHISNLKTLPAGEGVSYGLRYTTAHTTRIATLPIGYGDGYKRCLTGKSDVLIGGIRCPQVGTICMDQMMVDVTEVPNVAVGDEAVLIGRQGNEKITADDLAEKADTISYEILLSISDRVPRVYEE
ncbi:MAG: alanine racemase [Clostridia bacterium]|nr:alanine racemase [Clostridia bacterium]